MRAGAGPCLTCRDGDGRAGYIHPHPTALGRQNRAQRLDFTVNRRMTSIAAWDAWLDCMSERQIAERIGVSHPTVSSWVEDSRKRPDYYQPPASRQHFDVWNFPTDGTASGQGGTFTRARPF